MCRHQLLHCACLALPQVHPAANALKVAIQALQASFCLLITLFMLAYRDQAGHPAPLLATFLLAVATACMAYYATLARQQATLAAGWKTCRTPAQLLAWTYLAKYAPDGPPQVRAAVRSLWLDATAAASEDGADTSKSSVDSESSSERASQQALRGLAGSSAHQRFVDMSEELVLRALKWGLQHFHDSAAIRVAVACTTLELVQRGSASTGNQVAGGGAAVMGVSTPALGHLHAAVGNIAWFETDLWILALRCALGTRAQLDAQAAQGRGSSGAGGLRSGMLHGPVPGRDSGHTQVTVFDGAASSVHGGSTVVSTDAGRTQEEPTSHRRIQPTKLHEFREALQAALQADEEAMRHLGAVWAAARDATVSLDVMEWTARQYAEAVAEANLRYAAAVSRNPESSIAYRYYGDFLSSVVGLKSEAAFCTDRADSLQTAAAQRQQAEQSLSLQDMVLGRVRSGIVPPTDEDVSEPQLTLSGDPDNGFPIVSANAAAARLFGRHPQDVVGASVGALFPPAMASSFLQALGEAVGGITLLDRDRENSSGRSLGGVRVSQASVSLGRHQVWLGWNASKRCLVPMLMSVTEHFATATRAGLGRLTLPQLQVSLREVSASCAVFLVDCAGAKRVGGSTGAAASGGPQSRLAATLSRFASCTVVGACEAGCQLAGLVGKRQGAGAAAVTVKNIFKAASPADAGGAAARAEEERNHDLPTVSIVHGTRGTLSSAKASMALARVGGKHGGKGSTFALVCAIVQEPRASVAPGAKKEGSSLEVPMQASPRRDTTSDLHISRPSLTQDAQAVVPFTPTKVPTSPGGLGISVPASSLESKMPPAKALSGRSGVGPLPPRHLSGQTGAVTPRAQHLHDDCEKGEAVFLPKRTAVGAGRRSHASSVTSANHAERGAAALRMALLGVGERPAASRTSRVWGSELHGQQLRVYRDANLRHMLLWALVLTASSLIALTAFSASLEVNMLDQLGALSLGLWAAGTRLQVSQWAEASTQRMLVRPGIQVEPEETNLAELDLLLGDFKALDEDIQLADTLTAGAVEAVAQARGIDVNAPYVPPSNLSEAALLQQFQEDAVALKYPSDRMRWVPIPDVGSTSVMMSIFEVNQWCLHNLRIIAQLETVPDFHGSSAAATYMAAMHGRVWPAFNASIRARVETMKSFATESASDVAVVELLSFILVPIAFVAVGLSVLGYFSCRVAEDLLQPLRGLRNLPTSTLTKVQTRTSERLAEVIARRGGSGQISEGDVDMLFGEYDSGQDDSSSSEGQGLRLGLPQSPTDMSDRDVSLGDAQSANVLGRTTPQAGDGSLPDSARGQESPVRLPSGKRPRTSRSRAPSIKPGVPRTRSSKDKRSGRGFSNVCMRLGMLSSCPFLAGLIVVMALLIYVYGTSIRGVLQANSRAILLQQASFEIYEFRDAAGDFMLGRDPNSPQRAQAAQTRLLEAMNGILHGTPEGPLGTPVEPLKPDSQARHLLVEDACVPDARWQTNCSTVYEGVAANGGILQVFLRAFGEGNRLQAALSSIGGFQEGVNVFALVPGSLQQMIDIILLDKRVARDAVRVLGRMFRDEAVTTVNDTNAGKDTVVTITWVFLLLLSCAQAWLLVHANRGIVSVRSLLLQVPGSTTRDPSAFTGRVYVEAMQKQSKQTVAKRWCV